MYHPPVHDILLLIVGVGKREAHSNRSKMKPEEAVSVTGTRTTWGTIGPVPADSRQCTPSVRNCVT